MGGGLHNSHRPLSGVCRFEYIMTRILFLFIILVTTSSCSQKFTSPELSEHFSEAEMRDLHKLTDFFQSQMCGKHNDFNSCMDSLIPILGEFGWQAIVENVDFKEQQALYDSFESKVFGEIWSICKSRNPEEGWERKSLCLNTSGKYVAFLESLKKKSEIIKAYTEAALNAGDFGNMAATEYEIFNKTNRIDLNKPGIQVLIAVDYLSQNDQQKRREPWVEN